MGVTEVEDDSLTDSLLGECLFDARGNMGRPADLDGSGVVDFRDLLIVLGSWGPCE